MGVSKPTSSPNPQLFGSLVGSWRGPIIVIGGGPSAPSDYKTALEHMPESEAIIVAANDHGWKLGVQPSYAVCVDVMHTAVKQLNQTLCRQHNTPLISWRWFSDYRIAQWGIHADSGMTALIVAAMMGGNPVIPCGFNRYDRNTMYFHQRAGFQRAKNSELGRDGAVFNALKCDTIRTISGPLRTMWRLLGEKPPEVDPPIPHLGKIQQAYCDYRIEVVRDVSNWRLGRGENPPPGSIFAASQAEATDAIRCGAARLVPGWFAPA